MTPLAAALLVALPLTACGAWWVGARVARQNIRDRLSAVLLLLHPDDRPKMAYAFAWATELPGDDDTDLTTYESLEDLT